MVSGALKYKISDRISELSKPSQKEVETIDEESIWQVRQSALTGTCNQNVDALAKPIVRQSMNEAQFDPHAFTISGSVFLKFT